MKNLYPKFIIEGDTLTLGKCTFHRDLAIEKEEVTGGGLYNFSSSTKTFKLFGDSYEFGRAQLKNIKHCFDVKKVYTGAHNITQDFKFEYETESGEIILLN